MMFWIIASIVLFVAALLTFLPLLRGKTYWQPVALALVFLLPVAGLLLYKQVGTPQAIGLQPALPHAVTAQGADTAELEDLLTSLRGRLTETPEDLEGWILLARTLKTTQRYPEAVEALETARRIAPDNAFVLVELVETQIYASQQGQITPEMVAMLKEALAKEPGQQKGLWLMGIASAQAGDDEAAVQYWQSLLQQLEPGGTVASSVQQQIAAAQRRLGQEPTATATATATATKPAMPAATPPIAQSTTESVEPPAATNAWPGLKVSIAAGDALQSRMPAGATLFVIVRTPGPAMGPPLGVRRLNSPTLPLEITISDSDAMIKERTISSQTEIQLQARLSLKGAPQAMSGDWQSTPLIVPLSAGEPVQLILDQKVE